MSRGMKWGIARSHPCCGDRWRHLRQEATGEEQGHGSEDGTGGPASDLVAAVTASGKIEAETKVDISADITGRIIKIAVKEGDLVTKGQFLIQIDPAQFQAAVNRAEALVASSQASLVQAQANRDQAKRQLDRAQRAAEDQPEPDLGRDRRAGAAGLRRGGRDLRDARRPGGPGPRRAQGGAGQPGPDPALRADQRAG